MLKLASGLILSLALNTSHARLQLLPPDFSMEGNKEDYRLGDEWGKKRVTDEVLLKASKAFNRAAKATAILPIGGTGFYIGKFNGIHVLATNHHVCEDERACVGDDAEFRLLNKRYTMTKLFASMPDIDLALLAIEVPVEDEKELLKIAKNFSFKKDITKGQELITIGFGVGGNPQNYMMSNQDSDCKVFSDSGEYRHMADPDEFNPAPYKAWSFAHACDISHGDSGSAMVDRKSGEVVGIVWTGRIPKSKVVQSSFNLESIFKKSSPAIWEELSYAVPARKIGEHLKELSQDSQLEDGTKLLFKAIIQ